MDMERLMKTIRFHGKPIRGGTMPKSAMKTDPCQKEACAIQKCLQAYKYQEGPCQSVLAAMMKCCDKYGPGESVCCSGFLKPNPQT